MELSKDSVMKTKNKEETLNIDFHNKRLMLLALNKQPTVALAAKELGISERTMYRWMDEYKIVQVRLFVVEGNYELKNTF
jgi:transcriptional regulator with PAS, ATPase and Fis domain